MRVDPTNQTMIVGSDVKRYRVETMTLEDLSQENDDDDTIVFTQAIMFKRYPTKAGQQPALYL